MTETLLQSLTASGASIVALAGGIDIEEWTWRPDEHRWSCLEILCHLVDEERDDFRTRIMRCLRDPDEAWPPIDPGEWAR